LDHLWSPWRLEYVISKKPEGCVFCSAPGRSNNDLSAVVSAKADPLVVHQGQLAYVILNLYPYNTGHLLVVP
jgi:ATP adenylyltransferase